MHKNNDFKLKLILPCRFEARWPYSSYRCSYYLPYGMGVLTAFLRKHNYYVEQEDLSIRFNRHSIFLPWRFKNKDLDLYRSNEKIRRFLVSGEGSSLSLFIDKILNSTSIEGFDVIGFSIPTYYHFLFALLLSKKIKQKTNAPIVFGGSFITHCGQLYPKVFNLIDYMIIGDGSIPVVKLIDYLNNKIAISEVPNLLYKEDGRLITTFREDYPLEDISIPDFSDLPLELYNNKYSNFALYGIILPYQTSRGCTNRCSFCSLKGMYNKLEFKSYEKVLSELSQMKERYNSKMFHFSDDAINNSYEYLEGLCNLFIKNNLNINWNVYAKVGNLDKHILRKMKEAGCCWLVFGIESGSNRMLKMMNKGFISEQASNTLRETSKVGLRNIVCFMAGYPYETQKDIKQTLEFIKKNKKYMHYIKVYRFDLVCGSPIYFNPERYGIKNLISTPFPLCNVFTFDEPGGLKWEQKQKQQVDSQRQIVKAGWKHIMLKFFLFSVLDYLNLFLSKLIKRICHLFNPA